ncbi:MORN repeat-containing protein [Flammeovirga kamogawensis]|uniref:Uncharacterized protein n=1 Tax=Flammeovirga kamogawensis TaxID=373891 RepID=A0ABX8H1D7_9BACT|nr:hypothetical protein [Flammeovirga kamogawensis]MBB6462610.1 hypothetical protein [Flammeovirga kamogawensis]QWG09645.1 hypothetical protein KM029_23870 [Flammeovirga kamogawensis]TRX65159.1 hypothetical protein EO216_21770 [Flammeovirga kamogawensis]
MKKIVSLVSLFILFPVGYYTYNYINALAAKIEKLEAVEGENINLALRVKADSFLLADDYEKALRLFKSIDSMYSTTDYTNYALDYIDNKKVPYEMVNELEKRYYSKQRYISSLKRKQVNLNDSINRLKKNYQILETNQEELQTDLYHSEGEIISLKHELVVKDKAIDKLHFINQDNAEIDYIGEVANDMANGFGYAIFEKKGFYEGYWKNNKRYGEGTYSWVNGDRFEGNFKKGIRDGFGVYYFNSGEKYEGFWSDNLREGFGVIFDKKGEVVFEGIWEKDKPKKKKLAK